VGKDELSLGSSESLRIDSDGNMLAPSTEQLDGALGWVAGQLSISDMPIKSVLPLLKRWYALDVLPPEAALLNRRVTIRAGLDSARVAMTALEQSGSVLFDSNGKKWILRDVAKK
jgi:ferric-dicitrate binding protein FerR (iron transport regulator)